MINEVRSFRKILREWGHDVYLQRILSNGNYSENLEKITTRQVGQSGMINTDSMSQNEEGINVIYDAVYYFEANVNPKEGDRIYEDISSKNHRNYSMYVIQAASLNRGRGGKNVFWSVGVKREK